MINLIVNSLKPMANGSEPSEEESVVGSPDIEVTATDITDHAVVDNVVAIHALLHENKVKSTTELEDYIIRNEPATNPDGKGAGNIDLAHVGWDHDI